MTNDSTINLQSPDNLPLNLNGEEINFSQFVELIKSPEEKYIERWDIACRTQQMIPDMYAEESFKTLKPVLRLIPFYHIGSVHMYRAKVVDKKQICLILLRFDCKSSIQVEATMQSLIVDSRIFLCVKEIMNNHLMIGLLVECELFLNHTISQVIPFLGSQLAEKYHMVLDADVYSNTHKVPYDPNVYLNINCHIITVSEITIR